MGSIFAKFTLAAVVACGALSGPLEACEGVSQFRSDCYSAQVLARYEAPPAFFVQPPPMPAAYFYQQAQFVAPPQPVVAAYSRSYSAALPINAGYTQAFTAGAPVAIRGRFAGNPAVGGQQLNLAINAGVATGRERVLRPTLFKRKVAAPLTAAPVVGAIQLPGYP
jgi:hypothetical protein